MIDSHQHFWKFDPVRDSWITQDMSVIRRDFLPEDLAPILKENGFDGCVAVQADQSVQETKFLIALAEQNHMIKGVVGWIDLRSRDLEQELNFFKAYPVLKGFRHIVQGEPAGFMNDESFRRGVSMLSSFGFTYDLLIYHYQLEEAIDFVRALPDVNIVLDHLAKPSIRTNEIEAWKKNIKTLASFENVYCKLSGMTTEANWANWKSEDFTPYLDVVMNSFGPTRLMYGSDWPVCLLAAGYKEQLKIVQNYIGNLSDSERDHVMGRNAINFYHL